LTTLRQVMPSRLRHRLDALTFTTISAGFGDADSVSPEVLVAISAAVRAREVFRFDYSNDHSTDNSEITPPRRVEPHHLVTSKRRWYLVAWDLERDDWRIFRADRITPRTPNGPRFTPKEIPGGDVSEYVSARFKGSEHINNWPCHGKVVLHRPASYVLPFVGDGIVEDLGPEQCSLEAGSWSWTALAASFNRFDTDIDVVGPAELTHAFAQLAARNAATAAS
ncbi:WYL domain-containing protein, partial [Rhodococcus erythropolis]|nr:WYL domain-containing protein [Rhodococcus erythropolis]